MRTPREKNFRKAPAALTEEQKALLTLLAAASTRGITSAALLLAASDAEFDLTFDFVRATLRNFTTRDFAEFRGDRWYIKTAGKREITLG